MTLQEYNKSVDAFSDGLFRFALKTAGNQQLADDIVQESFARLWQKVDTVSFEKCKSYLFTTAYNYFIDITRKEKRMVDTGEDYFPEEHHSDQYSDVQEVLHEALQKIPEIQKTVILLRDYEGYSYQEIGEITNLSEAQVKVYIFRARKALRGFLVKLENVI